MFDRHRLGRDGEIAYLPTTITWKLSGMIGARPFFCPAFGSGTGPKSAPSR